MAREKAKILTEKIYDFVAEEGEERSCEDISEKSCVEAPQNFMLNVLNGGATKLAEQLASPGVALPWILAAIGAPASFAGILVPAKNAGSLLPQLIVSGQIRGFPRRKFFWIVPAAIQGVMMVIMAVVVSKMHGTGGGFAILGLLLFFSMASGVSSIAFKDVVAKTIPKGKRGRMLAYRATLGGIFTLVAGLFLYYYIEGTEERLPYVIILLGAAVFWFLGVLLFIWIKEEKGATQGGRTPINELKKGLELLKKDRNLVFFVVTRALLMAIPLATPFFVLQGRSLTGATISGLGLMVLVTGLANIFSSPLWGRFADQSSRKMMLVAAGLGIFNCIYVLSFPFWPESWQSLYTFVPVLLLNVVAHAGARLSRKTYLVDFAPAGERPLYVSLSNTLIGIFTIIAAGLSLIAELGGVEAMIMFFILMLGGAIFLGTRLREV